MKIKYCIALVLLSISTLSQAIPVYNPDGHIATSLEIDVAYITASVKDEGLITFPQNGDAVTTSVSYNNGGNASIGQASAFGSATITAQAGHITGVSNWQGHQPQPWFGHGGTGSTIESLASFTIPDITIDYRGIDTEEKNVPGKLHVTTNLHGFGWHTVDMFALISGNYNSGSLKRVVDAVEGDIAISGLVSEFSGWNLPVDEMFDLSLQTTVASGSRQVPLLIHEVGVKTRSHLNWSVVLGGSPAFILPTGYYANSADGSIVDNYFVGNMPSASTGNIPSASVPSPGTLILFSAGLLGLGFYRWRRKI